MDIFLNQKSNLAFFPVIFLFLILSPTSTYSAPTKKDNRNLISSSISKLPVKPIGRKYPPRLIINKQKYKKGELLVKFKSNISSSTAKIISKRYGAVGNKKFGSSPDVVGKIHFITPLG